MTTENNQPENSDVSATVVEQSFASETPATSEETEVATPAQEQVQTTEIRAEEAVRPFTDFIEEFRQTEVRFDSLLPESQIEPFSSPISNEEHTASQFTPNWDNTPFGESTLLEGTSFALESVDTRASTQSIAPVESIVSVVEEPAEPSTGFGQLSTQEQQPPAPQPKPAIPTERPVSPLLRPASRIRSPRQGGPRHQLAGEQAVPRQEVVKDEIPAQPPVEEKSQAEAAPVQPTPQEEQPRPPRRYRFDRREPAVSNVPAAQAPAAPLQMGERDEQAAQQSNTTVAQQAEQPAPKQELVQEPVATQASETPKEAHSHDSRRKHGQERQHGKEQAAAPTPGPTAAEVIAPVTEAGEAQTPAVAPEDLPPLEYSELQKASSRRHRRRRGSTAAATPLSAKPVTPDLPSVAQTPSSPSPLAGPPPGTTPASPAPFSLLSGYTLNQMNHGKEATGPFMGPEPSPARGSNIPRGVRPIRNEAQRAPAHPARPNEGAPSPASIHHLANVVAQAIQVQSDRMVAEIRHANQIPTNIAVSLPPFPSTERVGVFVDVANLLYSARTLRMTVDFGKLLDFLRGNRRLVRAHAYCPTSPQPGDDQMFLQAVKGLGYRITTKDYKTFSSGAKKADLDLDLCMDVVRLVEGKAVDCIVLVSGDSDFMPMLDYCSDHGVRVEVAAFDESMSATLRQSCDLFINLSMLDEIRA